LTFEASAFGTNQAWTSQNTYPRFLADVNGDGRADIVGFGGDGVYVSLATGNGDFAAVTRELSAFSTAQSWTDENTYPRFLADVNGDHLADIVGFGGDGVYVSLATGNGHFAAPTLELAAFVTGQSWSNQNTFPRALADVNDDGMADIVGFGAAGVYVSHATGGGHFGPVVFAFGGFGTNQSWSSNDVFPRFLTDETGDHKADIVGFGSAGVYVSLSQDFLMN
jgi:hypothetical protein